MYTIDEFIQRLKDLREIAPDGGATPVAISDGDCDSFEVAEVELQPVRISTIDSGIRMVWKTYPSDNTHQVAKIY